MKKTKITKMSIVIVILTLLALGVWVTAGVFHSKNQTAGFGEVVKVETPDRTEATEHPKFIKVVYDPIIPAGTNIIEPAKITANGFNDVYGPRKVKDGKTLGNSYWEGAPGEYPNILTASWEEEQTIHALKLMLCPQSVWSTRIQTFSVEISEDGENFTEFIASAEYEFNPDRNNEVVLEFDDTTVRAVQLVFTANTGAPGAQVAELEVYSNQ